MIKSTLYNSFLVTLVLISFNAYSAKYAGETELFHSNTLTGIDALILNIDIQKHSEYQDLRYLVDINKLEDDIRAQLEAAGINVIDINHAREYPNAAMANFKLTAVLVSGRIYNVNHKLTIKRKLRFADNDDIYAAVDVWSRSRTPGLMKVELSRVYRHSADIFDKFITDYISQNLY